MKKRSALTNLINQVDEVIASARAAQAETGPDPDYRRYAEEDLRDNRASLVAMLERALRPAG